MSAVERLRALYVEAVERGYRNVDIPTPDLDRLLAVVEAAMAYRRAQNAAAALGEGADPKPWAEKMVEAAEARGSLDAALEKVK